MRHPNSLPARVCGCVWAGCSGLCQLPLLKNGCAGQAGVVGPVRRPGVRGMSISQAQPALCTHRIGAVPEGICAGRNRGRGLWALVLAVQAVGVLALGQPWGGLPAAWGADAPAGNAPAVTPVPASAAVPATPSAATPVAAPPAGAVAGAAPAGTAAGELGLFVTLGSAAQQNAGLQTGPAQMGALTGTIDAMAMIQPEASHLVRIHPAGVGKVLSVAVVPGQHVNAGDVLLTYQNHALHGVRLQITKAQAALSTAQAALQNARATYERGRALEGGAVSAGETRRRFTALRAAEDEVQARQADLDTLRHQLESEYNSVTESDASPNGRHDETSRIIAPSAGEVQTVGVGVADDIGPNTELVALADLSTVWIVSDILPQDAQRVQPGGVQVTVPEGQARTVLHSTITSIGYLADPATGLVHVISRADNADGRLHPGMFLTTRLPTRDPTPGVVVPAGAVVDIDGVSTVFVPNGPERFQVRPVRVGAEQDGKVVVLSGLAAGETVVTQGAFTLKSVLLKSSMGDD